MLYVPITINIEDVKSFCSLKLSEVFDKIVDIYEDYESGLLNKNDAYIKFGKITTEFNVFLIKLIKDIKFELDVEDDQDNACKMKNVIVELYKTSNSLTEFVSKTIDKIKNIDKINQEKSDIDLDEIQF